MELLLLLLLVAAHKRRVKAEKELQNLREIKNAPLPNGKAYFQREKKWHETR